jgi:hypothetical protein
MARPGDQIVSISLPRISFEMGRTATNRERCDHADFDAIARGEAMTNRQGEAIRTDCK